MGVIKIFSSKTINITKVILLLVIVTFFLPFVMVSCAEEEISFSGFAMTFGKNVSEVTHQEGNIAVIFLALPSVALLVVLFIRKIKKDTNIFKNILVILPIFNIIACITVGIAARITFNNQINSFLGGFHLGGLDDHVEFSFSYGFVLYLLLNIVLLVIGSVNHVNSNKTKQPPHESVENETLHT